MVGVQKLKKSANTFSTLFINKILWLNDIVSSERLQYLPYFWNKKIGKKSHLGRVFLKSDFIEG